MFPCLAPALRPTIACLALIADDDRPFNRCPAQPLDAVPSALGALVPALLRRDGDGLAVKDAASGQYLHADAIMLDWLGCERERVSSAAAMPRCSSPPS